MTLTVCQSWLCEEYKRKNNCDKHCPLMVDVEKNICVSNGYYDKKNKVWFIKAEEDNE